MRRAVFLDRDGTLIRNHHYGCDPDAIELLEGVVEGLGLLKRAGYVLIVATNQSGVARGHFTEEQLAEMHRRLGQLLTQQGAGIDGIYYCPHHPEGVVEEYSIECDCRKPRPGMVIRACSDLSVAPEGSWFIGDTLDDVEAGNRAGCRSVLVDVGTEGEPETPERVPDYVAADFLDAVRHVLRNTPGEVARHGEGRAGRDSGTALPVPGAVRAAG